ncbi:MAG: hypothetical protein Q9182_001810 [Xanthomendoza sp. 2 TL-2023]
MPSIPSQLPKDQPWKAHWSPVNKTAETEGQKYLVDESGALLVDGVNECTSADHFSELACARKEPEAAKAQPWKSHWSAGNKASFEARKYLVDESGNLLIDGDSSDANFDRFSELAACCKADK